MYAVIAMKMAGTNVLIYPRANPRVTFEAGPALQVYANYLTGEYAWDVTYSVKAAIIIPDIKPNIEQR